MLTMLVRNWWLIALRGVAGILFGILAMVWPALTLLTLLMLFGAYFPVDGVFAAITGSITLGRKERWWGQLLSGISGIVIGLITLSQPQVTAIVLLYFIAAWAALMAIFQIVAGIQLRRVITNE
jgi:uncharacterized membrane protein HdeD (DUF308 family)